LQGGKRNSFRVSREGELINPWRGLVVEEVPRILCELRGRRF
jgi:hypothetical protein